MASNSDQLRDVHGRFAAGMVDRLHGHLEKKGVPNARAEAVKHLQNTGILHPGSERLTAKGVERSKLGPEERAKTRAADQLGRKPADFRYNPKTGRAELK